MSARNENETLRRIRAAIASHQPQSLAGDHPDAAVAVALTDHADEPRLLLTRRADTLVLHPGEVAFPGGKRDNTDSSLLMTATREMEEEVGIPATAFEYLGCLRQRLTRSGIRVTPCVGIIPCDLPLQVNPDEIDSAFEMPLSILLEEGSLELQSVRYQGLQRQVAHIRFGNYHVWGVTAMIIVDLMNSLLQAGLPVDENER